MKVSAINPTPKCYQKITKVNISTADASFMHRYKCFCHINVYINQIEELLQISSSSMNNTLKYYQRVYNVTPTRHAKKPKNFINTSIGLCQLSWQVYVGYQISCYRHKYLCSFNEPKGRQSACTQENYFCNINLNNVKRLRIVAVYVNILLA